MNREILFKAKRKDWENLPKEEWWLEGAVIPSDDDCVYIATSFLHGKEGELLIVAAHEVIPDTLCQYTGLTDKNIWENDIVRNEKGDIGVVQWFEEHVAFMIWNKTKNCVCYLAENDFSKIEVIGNIFDNADLLEVE